MSHPWIADRTKSFDSSGIRRVFELAARLEKPINLSIGQPDFDVPPAVREACVNAIQSRKNGYALTQGMPVLKDKIQARVDQQFRQADRKAFVTSGTSGGLVLVMMSLVNPGDEVIYFDPYFVVYEALIRMMGGIPRPISTYPDFRIDLNRLTQTVSPRTKMILVNSPANPTGVTASDEELRGLANLAAERNIALVSDEIYSEFTYDEPFRSPAQYNDQTIVVDGFSKSHAMTGWRLGFAHGPSAVIDTMIKVQQYTFVCAPQPVQWAGAVAMDVDMSSHVAAYRAKRDMILMGLGDRFEIVKPCGAFYIFPKVPRGTASEFVARAMEKSLLIIPGKIFSQFDTHFRISYAADDDTLARGIEVLRELSE